MNKDFLTQRDVEFINQTARTIHSYLRAGRGIYWSWGAHGAKAILYDGKAALQLSVNGFLCKGKLIVAYNEGKDLFEVATFNRAGRALQAETDVYCDQLVSVCDRLVESGDNEEKYKANCKTWLNNL